MIVCFGLFNPPLQIKFHSQILIFFVIQADVDGNGTIDYSEFITATIHMNKMDKEDHLYSAFQYFDKDGSG